MTFVFENRPPVICDTYETFAEAAEGGDYLLCPYMGVILLADVEVIEDIVYMFDLQSHAHLYSLSSIVTIGRVKDATE